MAATRKDRDSNVLPPAQFAACVTTRPLLTLKTTAQSGSKARTDRRRSLDRRPDATTDWRRWSVQKPWQNGRLSAANAAAIAVPPEAKLDTFQIINKIAPLSY
jgi:hypothetical protein